VGELQKLVTGGGELYRLKITGGTQCSRVSPYFDPYEAEFDKTY